MEGGPPGSAGVPPACTAYASLNEDNVIGKVGDGVSSDSRVCLPSRGHRVQDAKGNYLKDVKSALFKKFEKERSTKDDEGPPSVTALPHWLGMRPGKPAPAPVRSKSDGRRPTRERGRPARMHCRCVPLSFPAMAQPATLPAGTAWARQKQRPGRVAGRAGWMSWPRLCQDVCGRDARAPGWASSRDLAGAMEVHRSLCLLVVRLQQPSAGSTIAIAASRTS